MSYASRLLRAVRFVPAAAPAGRALLNLPPAQTVLPTTACDQTTPSICTVGNASAVMALFGAACTGAGAASAAPAPANASPAAVSEMATAVVMPVRSRVVVLDTSPPSVRNPDTSRRQRDDPIRPRKRARSHRHK